MEERKKVYSVESIHLKVFDCSVFAPSSSAGRSIAIITNGVMTPLESSQAITQLMCFVGLFLGVEKKIQAVFFLSFAITEMASDVSP